MELPVEGNVFISLRERDKNKRAADLARKISELGFRIVATEGTAEFLESYGIEVERILKVSQGRPNVIDAIINKQIHLIINTPSGKRGRAEGYMIRRAAVDYGIPYITTLSGAYAAVRAIEAIKEKKMTVKSIQEYHEEVWNSKNSGN
jgi:carbamoyl-phosphate synthase large subunit